MSREQAATYRKFRQADDSKGNLGWAAGMHKKGMCIAAEASEQTPVEFEFSIREKALWELLRIPRIYTDLENARLLPPEDVRAFIRGLIAADVLDILMADVCRSLIPLEVKRAVATVKGVKSKREASTRSKLKAKVYRPNIGDETFEKKEEKNKKVSTPKVVAEIKGDIGAPQKAGELNREERIKKKWLTEAYRAMKNQTHYAFLEVENDADLKEIKAAYVNKARELHPDNIAGTELENNQKIVEMADRLFKRLQEAHRILTAVGSRSEYDVQLKRSGGAPLRKETGKVKRPREAQLAFRKAEVFFNKKEFKQADQYYKLAIEFDPDVEHYFLSHIWCQYFDERVDKSVRSTQAKKNLNELLQKKNMAEAAYRLGMIAGIENREKEAIQYYKKTLSLEPNHSAALQEKRLWEMRKRNDREKKTANERSKSGVLGRFFKK